MGVLVLIFLGWLASQYGRPLLFAGLWALFALFSNLAIEQTGLIVALIQGVLAFALAGLYFWLLDRFSDQLLIWLAILIGFPALAFVVQLQLLASPTAG
ncbi:hypothetical protein S4A8_14015 [Salinisphaera sp. S4-8]|uniref:hypothetical protein n=1 Tax=Salinisphaera sp. S4-8 TaxID=633357 RepID=UPI003340222A